MRRPPALALAILMGSCAPAFAVDPASEKLTHRGMDQVEAGRYQAAIAAFTRAIEADASNAQAWHERAMARLELGQDAEAISDFQQALKIDPRFPGSRNWLAHTLGDRGEHRAAAEHWLQVLRDEPDGPYGMGVSPLLWRNCAEQFALAGERHRAIELLEEYFAQHAARVTQYARDETAPMRLLARLYDEAGQKEKSEALRQRARASRHKVPADDM